MLNILENQDDVCISKINHLKSIIETQRRMIKQRDKEIAELKSFYNSTPGYLYHKNRKGIYIGANTNCLKRMRALGLVSSKIRTPADIVGLSDYDLFTQEVCEIYRKHDNDVLRTGRELLFEEPAAITYLGKKVVQVSIKAPLYNSCNEIVGITGCTFDLKDLIEKTNKTII